MTARASLFTDHRMSGHPMRTNTDISGQFGSILLTIHQQIPIFLLSSGGHQGMELRLCIVVELFCSPGRDIFPHISLHDLPHHGTMR